MAGMLDSVALSEAASVRAREVPGSGAAVPFWSLLLVAVVFYGCLFSHLGTLGLVGPDEPRYAAVAREMAESGDWITPRLNGHPWFEKPVLYYWAAAGAFRLLGVTEFAGRLPSALAAALAVLALAWAAWRFYGSTAGGAALLIVPTCIGVFGFARAATPDMLFSTLLTTAMLTASWVIGETPRQTVSKERAKTWARLAFGAFLGAAALAKGPAAIVLAGGSTSIWALTTRRWRDALRLAHPLALTAFCLTALPWYLLCATRNPEFVRTFLFTHNIERYLTPLFHHEQPFWFFGSVLLLGLLPWTVLLAGVARDAGRIRQQRDWTGSPGFFFACWAISPLLFFTFSKSKLPGYVLPSAMILALLFAHSVGRIIEEKDAFGLWLLVGIGGTFVALAASAGYWVKRLPPEAGFSDPHRIIQWTASAATGGVLVMLLGVLQRRRMALLAAALLTAGLIEAANRSAVPQLDPYVSARTAARAGLAQPAAAENVFAYSLRAEWRYGLNFYWHREMPEWTSHSSLPAWVYTNAAGLAEFERRGLRLTVVKRSSPQAMLVHLLAAGPATRGRDR